MDYAESLPGKSLPREHEETPPIEAMLPQSQILAPFPGSGLGKQALLMPITQVHAFICGKVFFWLLQSISPCREPQQHFPGHSWVEAAPCGLCEPEKKRTHPPNLSFYLLLTLGFKHKCCGLRITRSCPCAPIPWSPLVLHFQVSDCNYTN